MPTYEILAILSVHCCCAKSEMLSRVLVFQVEICNWQNFHCARPSPRNFGGKITCSCDKIPKLQGLERQRRLELAERDEGKLGLKFLTCLSSKTSLGLTTTIASLLYPS